MNQDRGFVHLYTGNGKGKSTAAMGLALRALAAGKRVYVGQFVKDMVYGEIRLLSAYDGFKAEQYGRGCFIYGAPDPVDVELAMDGLATARKAMLSGEYDVVILDEVNIATHFGLITVDSVLEFLAARPSAVEVVLTGRKADARLLEVADLVTDMQEVKHYYQQGVLARPGIEN